MTLNDLKIHIVNKTYPKLLVFYGPETYVKQVYLNKISNSWVRQDNISNSNLSGSLFKGFTTFYCVDGEYLKGKSEEELNNIKNKCLTGNDQYIFMLSDKPSSDILKIFKDYIVEFNTLKTRYLLKYFKKYELPDETVLKICQNNYNDYLRIENELDKIKNYAADTKTSNVISYDILNKQGILLKPITDVLFDFTNSITSGNIALSNVLLYKIKKSEEPVLIILDVLTKQFRQMFYVKEAGKDQEKLKSLGIPFNVIGAIQNNCRNFSLEEIQRNIMILQKIESGLKIGDITEDVALDYLIVSLLS